MKKLGFILIAVLAACDDGTDDVVIIDDTPPGDEFPPPPGGYFEWRASIEATDIYDPLFGSALVRMNEGELAFTASIEIRNDIPGAVHPWHVHISTCGSGGPIVGSDDAYPRLFTGGDGFAGSDVLIRTGLDPNGVYHVNVHDSDFYFTTIIACGDLIPQ